MPTTNARTRRNRALRSKYGTQITFRSAQWSVGTRSVSTSEDDASLPKDPLGFSTVGADPRVFVFSCMDFTPYTGAAAPVEAEIITWHAQTYVISNVTFDDIQGDTNAINVCAFRRPD